MGYFFLACVNRIKPALTEVKRRKNLGAGIDGQPEPENLMGVAQPGAQFIQLQVREVEVGEEALVQGLRVLPSSGQKGS